MQKDNKVAKVIGIKHQWSFYWYLHAALLHVNPNITMYKDMDFLPQLPQGYGEPIGTQYNVMEASYMVHNTTEWRLAAVGAVYKDR